MAYYSVLDVTPTSDGWIPDYLPTANKLVANHGGKYLARTASHEQVEGDTHRFPNWLTTVNQRIRVMALNQLHQIGHIALKRPFS